MLMQKRVWTDSKIIVLRYFKISLCSGVSDENVACMARSRMIEC